MRRRLPKAVQRPTMKFVATKTADQLDLQGAAPGARAVGQPAHRHHQIRAFLLERGVAVRQGLRFLRAELPRTLATSPDVLVLLSQKVAADTRSDSDKRKDSGVSGWRLI